MGSWRILDHRKCDRIHEDPEDGNVYQELGSAVSAVLDDSVVCCKRCFGVFWVTGLTVRELGGV